MKYALKNIKHYSFILCIFVFYLSVSGQIKTEKKTTPKPQNNKPKLTIQQRQAIQELENSINLFSIPTDEEDIKNLPSQSDVICRSIIVLWDYQPEQEREKFIKLIDSLTSSYVLTFGEKKHLRSYFRQSIKLAITTLTKKDKLLASKLLLDFYKTEQDLITEKGNKDELLELAEDLLDVDLPKSLTIAESIIKTGFPRKMINYLAKLKSVSEFSHDNLLNKILVNLSSGKVYSFFNELCIQSYLFKEVYIAYPKSEVSDIPGFDKFEFPVSGVEIVDPNIFNNQKTQLSEVKNYISSSILGFSQKLNLSPDRTGLQSSRSYFLISKLAVYNSIYFNNSSEFTNRISSLVSNAKSSSINAQVTEANLEHIKFMANAVVIKYFGEAISDTAEDNTNDESQESVKIRILEQKILKNIIGKDFNTARKLLEDIKDSPTVEALTDYLNYSVIVAASKDNDFTLSEEKLKKITNQNVKVMSLFEMSSNSLKARNKIQTINYLDQAKDIIFNKLDKAEKPQMAIGLLGLYAQADKEKVMWLLLETVKMLDNTNNVDTNAPNLPNIYCLTYKGESIKLYSRRVVQGAIRYEFSDSDIEKVFSDTGKINWKESLQYKDSIENKFLRSKATLSLCRLILTKTTV